MPNRNGVGGFKPGSAGGPGRPRREVEKKYLRSAIARVPLKKWRAIVDRAVELAMEGDAAARTWLSKLLCGDDPLALIELAEQMQAALDNFRAGTNGRPA